MALLRASPPSSPSSATKRKSWARRCERACCSTIIYFPLLMVYGLTSWAVWVQASAGFASKPGLWIGYGTAFLGLALYMLLNWSYTIAVFTDPGSTLNGYTAYATVPSEEDGIPSLTVKSTGQMRYCKKCQTRKPDRAHHCSSCRRCVLKMDHHCPWLATCVGLRNYKPFILFLTYTCLFCILCFAVSATWVVEVILAESAMVEDFMPVNYILLAVLSGILGLVLCGFTGYHIYLAMTGQTTIESMEKTRYLAPLRNAMERQAMNNSHKNQPSLGDQLRELHANALPGVTRPEEGEERASPARESLQLSYQEMERLRERERYENYLDEQDVAKLPSAFDLGWRKNMLHVFGPELSLWWLPICNSTGNGWQWEPSPKWIKARDELANERLVKIQENQAFESRAHIGPPPGLRGTPPPRNEAEDARRLRKSGTAEERSGLLDTQGNTANWNDVPDDILPSSTREALMGASRPRSRNSPRRYGGRNQD